VQSTRDKELPVVVRYLLFALVSLAAGTARRLEKRSKSHLYRSAGRSLMVEADGASVHVSGSDANQSWVHDAHERARTEPTADTGVSTPPRKAST
jgi:hypothetical protein